MDLRSPFCSRAAFAALLLVAFGVATPAVATQLPFTGTLSISIAQLPPVLVAGSGVAALNANASGLHLESAALPAGVFSRSGFTATVSATSAFPIRGLQVTAANAAGSVARAGGVALHGAVPILGVAKVCLFAACGSAPLANVSVPVSVVGDGGTVTAAGAVNVTVQGAPWTTGASSGSARGPNGLTSSTAQPGGRLNLVTPIFISTNIGALAQIAATGRIEVTFQQPRPFCEVAANQSRYVDGDSLVLTRVRFANPGTANASGHLRLEFVVPVGGGLVRPVLDTDATLSPAFDTDIAPVDAFTVDPSQPRGDYQFRCRISDPSGATVSESVADFRFE